MARVLIVPCGCRGRALARELRAAGHAVRGTTRGAHVAEIAEVAEPYVGDPDRIGTLMDALHGVTIVVWLAGGLDIPEGRVRMFWEKIVDTGVRGVVHEGGWRGDRARFLRALADPARDRRRRSARGRQSPTRLSRSARIRAVAPHTMCSPTS